MKRIKFLGINLWASVLAQLVEPACNPGDPGSFPELGRSPGEGNANPTQVFLPGEFQGQRSLMATVHGVIRVGHNLATKPPGINLPKEAKNKQTNLFSEYYKILMKKNQR